MLWKIMEMVRFSYIHGDLFSAQRNVILFTKLAFLPYLLCQWANGGKGRAYINIKMSPQYIELSVS